MSGAATASDSTCTTLTTTQVMWLDVSPLPCDRTASAALDGRLVVERLVTVRETVRDRRGVHAGDFRWTDGVVIVDGSLHGITNAGVRREPATGSGRAEGEAGDDRCVSVLMGRLSGRVVRSPRDPGAVGALVSCVYRLHVRLVDDRQGSVVGVLEGALLIPCD